MSSSCALVTSAAADRPGVALAAVGGGVVATGCDAGAAFAASRLMLAGSFFATAGTSGTCAGFIGADAVGGASSGATLGAGNAWGSGAVLAADGGTNTCGFTGSELNIQTAPP